jgi:hypothetical protein
VTVTSPAGYRYELVASSLRRVTTANFNGQSQDAPPGKTFVTVDVEVKNPLTDRQEPLDPLAASGSPNTAFSLAFPTTSLSAFGISGYATATGDKPECKDGTPPEYCLLIGGTAALVDSSGGPVQLQPGANVSTVVHVVSSSSYPESAPLEKIALFVQFLFETAIRVPLGG